ncbi:Sm-like ribonucleoprotein [Colletotrichum somersetense]|nr:Sm-like ribonucleoprotein [Colletotrichum somersetense]
MSNKQGKMAGYINYRMRVTLNDGRQMTGQMLAFDKHMNLVLADTEEFRRVKIRQNKPAAPGASSASGQTIEKEEKRTLGLTIVRGAHIVSLSVESEPPADPSARLGKSAPGGISSTLAAGPGVARPAGRGAAPAPPSLAVSAPPGTPFMAMQLLTSDVGSCCRCWRRRPSRIPSVSRCSALWRTWSPSPRLPRRVPAPGLPTGRSLPASRLQPRPPWWTTWLQPSPPQIGYGRKCRYLACFIVGGWFTDTIGVWR